MLITSFNFTSWRKVRQKIWREIKSSFAGRLGSSSNEWWSCKKVVPVIIWEVDSKFMFRKRIWFFQWAYRRSLFRWLKPSKLIFLQFLKFGCFLWVNFDIFANNINQLIHFPIFQVIEIMSFSTEIDKVLRVVSGFDDINSQILLLGLKITFWHLNR